MAQATAYSSLYPYMVADLPLCDEPIQRQALQKAGRQFLKDTEGWRENLRPIAIVDYQRDYTLAHDYTANVRRIRWVKVNGMLQQARAYSLVEDTILRWETGYEPAAGLTDMMLVCGTAGQIVIAGWTGITDGSVTFSLNGSTHAVTGLSFASVTTMAEVAKVIENGLRAAALTTFVHVRWYTNHFRVFTESGSMSYLTAGSAGTNIAGTGYMNGLTGGSGVSLAPYILANVAFMPHLVADDLPGWVLERYAEGIIAYAMEKLLRAPAPWRDLVLAESYAAQARSERGRARRFNADAGCGESLQEDG